MQNKDKQIMPAYLLTYKFHSHTINTIDKEIQDRCRTFETFEELLTTYQQKKNARLWETNTDFKVFKLMATEMDIDMLDVLL